MEDRRNKKTEQLIKRVFLKLLKEKSLNKITVAEIARLADLGRGTFYLHYGDVYIYTKRSKKSSSTDFAIFSNPLTPRQTRTTAESFRGC